MGNIQSSHNVYYVKLKLTVTK